VPFMVFVEEQFLGSSTGRFPLQEILNQLTKFGLTTSEAKAYLAVLRLGEGTGNSIAQVSSIPRQEAYRVLSKLEKLELVDRIIANPTRFKSAPLKTALARLVDDRKSKSLALLSELETAQNQILNQFSSFGSRLAENEGYMHLLHGRRVLERKLDLIKEASWQVAVVDGFREIVALNYNGALRSKSRLNSGKQVKILCTANKNVSANLLFALRKNVKLKFAPDFCQQMIIVDDARAIVKMGESQALETNNWPFVKAMAYLFESLWQNAPNYERSDSN
jgi:sugar-specific transcriptional regulator TrmB